VRDRAISEATRAVLDAALARFKADTLSDHASVTIGLVTGDTPFFIRRESDWRKLSMAASSLVPLAPKSKWLKGLCLTAKDAERYRSDDVPCLMFSPKALTVSSRRLIESYPSELRTKNATFKKREKWYRPDDEQIPDLLGVFMTQLNPRLILNRSGLNCTNSYYRVNLKDAPVNSDLARLLVISMQCTVTQLVAEIIGRVRGSGALKLEPSEFRLLPTFTRMRRRTSGVREAFKAINSAIMSGDDAMATRLADRFIFGRWSSGPEMRLLQHELNAARARRSRANTVARGQELSES
jgi:hypothetical protein